MVTAVPRLSHGEGLLAWQVRMAGFPSPDREHRFDPARRWRFDFAWPSIRVAVEVEGGTWVRGRHTSGSGYAADLDKYNSAALAGWLVVRVTTGMVDDGRALQWVADALAARGLSR